MGRDQQPRNHGGRRRGEGQHLRREHQPESRRPVSAEPAVAHDLQRAFAGGAAEAVAGVGEPVLVEGAGGEQGRGGGEDEGQAHREDEMGEPEHAPRERADQGADERVVAGRGGEPRLGEDGRRAHRPSREELHREQEYGELFARAVPHPSRPLTPALSKLAISVIIAAAHLSTGHASRAPVPSPRRMSRSSNGRAPRASSTARWPGLGGTVRDTR